MKNLYKQALLAVLVAGFTSAASATLLSSLLQPGATLQVGDKTFANFTWSGPTGPAGITITGIGTGIGSDYLGIEIGGGLAQFGAGLSDWQLGYSVAASGGHLISDIHQYANVVGTAGSLVSVTEDVLNAPAGAVVATSHVGVGTSFLVYDPTDPPAELNDILVLAQPLQKVWVKKDILVTAFGPTDFAAVSIIDQRFSQTPVPEPTTVVAGAGALLLALFGANRSRRSVKIG
jgi:hypothetical protein